MVVLEQVLACQVVSENLLVDSRPRDLENRTCRVSQEPTSPRLYLILLRHNELKAYWNGPGKSICAYC